MVLLLLQYLRKKKQLVKSIEYFFLISDVYFSPCQFLS